MSTSEQKELEYFPQIIFCLFRFLKTTARKEFIQLPVGTFQKVSATKKRGEKRIKLQQKFLAEIKENIFKVNLL